MDKGDGEDEDEVVTELHGRRWAWVRTLGLLQMKSSKALLILKSLTTVLEKHADSCVLETTLVPRLTRRQLEFSAFCLHLSLRLARICMLLVTRVENTTGRHISTTITGQRFPRSLVVWTDGRSRASLCRT